QPLLERALKDDPSNELGHLDLGGILAAQGHNDAAVTHYVEAAKLAPNDAEPHWRLSRLYRLMGQTEKAREEVALVGKLKTQEYQSLHDQVAAAAKARHALEEGSSPEQQSPPQQ
ncbi:MAG TPA: tetratricopeptide repeat protein, partial [Terracidiphilus sp.]|nr:tetratricopeptide repeat protein [Terracidiphilus sp.]